MKVVITITNLISQVIHAVSLYVHIVRENRSHPNVPNTVTSVVHWWHRDVVTIDDYERYMLCEDIKHFSSMLPWGTKQRYNFRKHTKEALQMVLDDIEQAYSRWQFNMANGMRDEYDNPIEFRG